MDIGNEKNMKNMNKNKIKQNKSKLIDFFYEI